MQNSTASISTAVTRLAGIGPERSQQLARLKIQTVGDLLLHPPNRYEDRRDSGQIVELRGYKAVAARGKIVALGIKYYRKRTRSLFEMILEDGTARLHCRWWNMPFMQNYFKQGDELFVYGKLTETKPRTMDHPETEILEAGDDSAIHVNRIVPIYSLTEGLPQRWLRGLIWRVLQRWDGKFVEPGDGLPLADLPSREQALRWLHMPESMAEVEKARERLALDEFIELQLAIQRRRRNLQTQGRGLPCAGDNRLIKPFLKSLGFELTEAQKKVLREVRQDLGGQYPMRRLLQGDVGSGKTVVAACALLMAMESGFNGVIMAPTEILAEQHYGTFQRWFEPLGLTVSLRTGNQRITSPPLPELPLPLKPGSPASAGGGSLVVGTHALIEVSFKLDRLGLVIIDEQHKFGVTQREKLLRKGHYPHLLVMTATPIPRTLGLTLYGDLDSSVIAHLPPGRGRIKTYLRTPDTLPKVWEFIREKLAEGRQVYVVYPRVEDAVGGVKAVVQEGERLRALLAPHSVAVLHGRLKSDDKEQLMTSFRAGTVSVLVATTVIEVGVDVPNATVMLVENAEQFGLAQLHQLRGRIGRGSHDSYCILVADMKKPGAKQRLSVLEACRDGFRIAEKDLELRGPGELVGQDQSGLPSFRFGDLRRDVDLIERARREAARLLARD